MPVSARWIWSALVCSLRIRQLLLRCSSDLGRISYAGIRVPVPTEALQGRLSGLPDGGLVERDRIEVRFTSATPQASWRSGAWSQQAR